MKRDYVAEVWREIEEAREREAGMKARAQMGDGRMGGMFIREARLYLGLSQSEMASILQVATKTLQGWEAGKPPPRSILLLVELIRDFPEVRHRAMTSAR